jgi:uncharacterized protein YqeY
VVEKTPADELRARLRQDLSAAMRARRTLEVAALRAAMAAVDNAEAIEAAPARKQPPPGERIAGAVAGVGSTDVARRPLTIAELEQILNRESDDLGEQASRCESLGRNEEASRLRSQAEVIRRYRVAL